MARHFITGAELDRAQLQRLLERAAALKSDPLCSRALVGRSIGLIFERPSTRTRISFEAGVFELGGHPLLLRPDEMQLSRGESPHDTALVLSRHLAAIGLRSGSDALLQQLAESASVPVFNMLTPLHHPCQALADLLTIQEAFGRLEGLRIAYIGDATNVARSLAVLGGIAGMQVALASPAGYQLADAAALPGAVPAPALYEDPAQAAAGANVLYTDVWVSMGDEAQAQERRRALTGYTIDESLLDAAAGGAIALHCLPAHPGEEIAASVLYGERQRIWDQAENRRHAQKALLEWLLELMP